ncbi:MAG: histidine kinase [Chitinophagaceae bacterium]|nr:histidine kinase [Chitinophagaceae bacterium]
MTHRLKNDFYSLKEFTENTSHELQTPLTVIKSKLELLMQSDNLTDTQYKHLAASYDSTHKLGKLNDALGLLAKIENSQFEHTEEIDVNQLIENKLFNYKDILLTKSISLIKQLEGTARINMNPVLADILIENLINNSIKHNVNGGKITIETDSHLFKISNTGEHLLVDPLILFQRFSKSNSQSFGLGLSIVREICHQNNIVISYTYSNNWHSILLNF